jgi:hypothetical protein
VHKGLGGPAQTGSVYLHDFLLAQAAQHTKYLQSIQRREHVVVALCHHDSFARSGGGVKRAKSLNAASSAASMRHDAV